MPKPMQGNTFVNKVIKESRTSTLTKYPTKSHQDEKNWWDGPKVNLGNFDEEFEIKIAMRPENAKATLSNIKKNLIEEILNKEIEILEKSLSDKKNHSKPPEVKKPLDKKLEIKELPAVKKLRFADKNEVVFFEKNDLPQEVKKSPKIKQASKIFDGKKSSSQNQASKIADPMTLKDMLLTRYKESKEGKDFCKLASSKFKKALTIPKASESMRLLNMIRKELLEGGAKSKAQSR